MTAPWQIEKGSNHPLQRRGHPQMTEPSGDIRPHISTNTGAGQNATYDLIGLKLPGLDIPVVANVAVLTTPFPPAAGMGIAEPDIITIGYGVLSQFKTVWDYPKKAIYFLKP